MVLQSQLSLFKYSPNRVLLSGREKERQGGDTGQAKVAKSHNWMYFFFYPSADNYNFLSSKLQWQADVQEIPKEL